MHGGGHLRGDDGDGGRGQRRGAWTIRGRDSQSLRERVAVEVREQPRGLASGEELGDRSGVFLRDDRRRGQGGVRAGSSGGSTRARQRLTPGSGRGGRVSRFPWASAASTSKPSTFTLLLHQSMQ